MAMDECISYLISFLSHANVIYFFMHLKDELDVDFATGEVFPIRAS
jgi:hypothetical protein